MRECREQGETWLCILVRFPVLPGIICLRCLVHSSIAIHCIKKTRLLGHTVYTAKYINSWEALTFHTLSLQMFEGS